MNCWYAGVQVKLMTVHKQRPSRTYKCRRRTMRTTHLWKKWRDCCSGTDVLILVVLVVQLTVQSVYKSYSHSYSHLLCVVQWQWSLMCLCLLSFCKGLMVISFVCELSISSLVTVNLCVTADWWESYMYTERLEFKYCTGQFAISRQPCEIFIPKFLDLYRRDPATILKFKKKLF